MKGRKPGQSPCNRDRHGYAIRQAILEHASDTIEVEAGNRYRHNRQLDRAGLIEESGRRPAADLDDEQRRYFRMTPLGKRVLAAELLRLYPRSFREEYGADLLDFYRDRWGAAMQERARVPQ